jgi:lysozyme
MKFNPVVVDKFNPVIVDLSHFDDVRNWDAVKAFGILGVINKATEGPRMIDKTYATRRTAALDHDILYGAYHLLRPGNPIAQADHFLDVALNVAKPGELLLALDHEDAEVPLEDAKQWLQHVFDRTGRRAVLCSGSLIKQQLGDSLDPFLKQHRLWLSHVCSRPLCPKNWTTPWIIQFTKDGQGPEPHQVPGIDISSGIDLNHYGGTLAQLRAEWTNELTLAA